jgi:hypothetical protein
MCDILPFKSRRSKRVRAARPEGAPCDVVIFTGVRVDHPGLEVPPAPANAAGKPGAVL